ncbi:hypothetical protein T03_5799 [Trichinella britovi]|uniref:Uncharacterized protein n=1 Tax=Trichinella britovi TaxID=45882 RepID=A0A0V1DGY0_TRIBR|nr:hypothetical protein T03_5799 [Trichinella britovi]
MVGYSTTNALGTFLQISDAKVVYDLKQSAGKRVRSVLLIRCQACSLPRFESTLANAKWDNPLSSISDVEAVLGYFKRDSLVCHCWFRRSNSVCLLMMSFTLLLARVN